MTIMEGRTGHWHPAKTEFPIGAIIEELTHLLPSQTPLKDFIHHNSLHAFQHHDFFEGIFRAAHLFGYTVTLSLEEFRNLFLSGRISYEILSREIIRKKGESAFSEWKHKLLEVQYVETIEPEIGRLRSQWRKHRAIDLDKKVQPLLFRILCSYLDQGIASVQVPHAAGGLMDTIRELESNSNISFFNNHQVRALVRDQNTSIEQLLYRIVGQPYYFEQYLFDQQFAHRGWSGMVATLEAHPDALLVERTITLKDLILLELLLELDALHSHFGEHWLPLAFNFQAPEKEFSIHRSLVKSELQEVLEIFQESFEWTYYDEVLMHLSNAETSDSNSTTPTFYAVFCIDERECSLRRHLEKTDPFCQTFGAPGFFGVEFFFLADGAQFKEKLCPAPVTPNYLIIEKQSNIHRAHDYLYHPSANSLLAGTFYALAAGWHAGWKNIKNLLWPKMQPAISDAFAQVGEDSTLLYERTQEQEKIDGLYAGFTVEEMAIRVEAQLRNIGMTSNFPPLVYFIAHGSSSANNPHHGAHDCGACSGRPGSVNARVFALMANHKGVRNILQTKGINIPEATQFVGALHDTAADQIRFFDLSKLTLDNKNFHAVHASSFEYALDWNAKERSRRFASISSYGPIQKTREKIQMRSVSLFEPRPELGHGTNALCFIGRRSKIKNIFLDRRAFLNSYDPTSDPEGKILSNVIRPIAPVCGGINLEYYFSRIDNHKLGAGTKLPHNVMGLLGVANSSDGDLRPGLPLQMIEVHDPVRLLVIVEQEPDILLKVISSSSDIYDWYAKGWIHLISLSPSTSLLHVFRNGIFEPYHTMKKPIMTVSDFGKLIEEAPAMTTFTIEDATFENLPVYTIK